MKVQVIRQDVIGASRNGLDNPIARAIQRVAGGRWYVYGPRACEITAPYRAGKLPYCAASVWKRFQETGDIDALEFCLQLSPSDSHSSIPP